MNKAMAKNLIREIRRSRARFFSIMGIALIGVAFFAGVRATGPDMKLSGDRYFDGHQLFDLMAVSSEGLVDISNFHVLPSRHHNVLSEKTSQCSPILIIKIHANCCSTDDHISAKTKHIRLLSQDQKSHKS